MTWTTSDWAATATNPMPRRVWMSWQLGQWQMYSYNPPDFEPEWRGKDQRAEDSGFDEYCLWHTKYTEDKGSRYANPVIQ